MQIILSNYLLLFLFFSPFFLFPSHFTFHEITTVQWGVMQRYLLNRECPVWTLSTSSQKRELRIRRRLSITIRKLRPRHYGYRWPPSMCHGCSRCSYCKLCVCFSRSEKRVEEFYLIWQAREKEKEREINSIIRQYNIMRIMCMCWFSCNVFHSYGFRGLLLLQFLVAFSTSACWSC